MLPVKPVFAFLTNLRPHARQAIDALRLSSRAPHVPSVLLAAALVAGAWTVLQGQQGGMGSARRAARPVRPIETDLAPITVDFRDVAADAGLTTPNVSGGRDAKRYILETTGSGVAIFDYD